MRSTDCMVEYSKTKIIISVLHVISLVTLVIGVTVAFKFSFEQKQTKKQIIKLFTKPLIYN